MAETEKFKFWVKMQAAKLHGKPSIDESVKISMKPDNIKVEAKDESAKWITRDDLKPTGTEVENLFQG